MTYKNDKLNILVENAEFFQIKEYENYIELLADNQLRFVVYQNSKIEARDNTTVYAYENSIVEVYGNSMVFASVNSTVYADDNSTVYAHNNVKVEAYANTTVYAYDNTTVYAGVNSTVYAHNNVKVEAYANTTVYAYDNSTVYADDKTMVVASEFSCINKLSESVTITTNNHFGAVIGQVFKLRKGITVYKKLRGDKIAVLKLNKGQVFQKSGLNKCLTDRAKVLRIESLSGETQYETGVSGYDEEYEVGKTVECSYGIHFFLTREKAEKYIGRNHQRHFRRAFEIA